MKFGEAIDAALAEVMASDERVIVFGEDVHMIRGPLYSRFGDKRVLPTPISEGAFVGAAVGAAMAGLRPVVELMMVDFAAVAMDAILNQMAKLEAFSGGYWRCPLVVRATCGAGYGDGGQHGQTLWGMLGAIPGLTVVVPSTPAEGYHLMHAALASDGPVIFLEHKLLSADWLEFLGRGGRTTVRFDVPPAGAEGDVPGERPDLPIGQARIVREGDDLTIVSLAVGVHRALEATEILAGAGITAEVIDLRSVRPLDAATVARSAARTKALLVVDEDYEMFGLSGELAAQMLERGVRAEYGRVCVETTIPYAREAEAAVLPNVDRIVAMARRLVARRGAAARVDSPSALP